jgi:hypothetical protein
VNIITECQYEEMLKTVFTMWRLVFGSKGKNNKRRRRSKEKKRRNMFVKARKKEGSDKVGIFLNNKTSSNQ